jgi:shikimate dehydrogenase
MDVSGKTKVAGIFGYPIEHTLSPSMHNAAFQNLGLDVCYVPFMVLPEALPDAVMAIRSLNMLGVNITIPYKEKVIPLLDKVNEEASFIGAVNTVTNAEGVLTGYNTDGRGFLSSLTEEGISIEGKNIFIIGAGGASRAVSYYLSEKASSLSLFDTDRPKAQKLANDLGMIRSNVCLIQKVENMTQPDIVINATPLGLKSYDPLPFNPDLITSEMVICDLIYKKTGLLKEAELRGAKIIDGSGMLLWQGAIAFELWTGVKPPIDIMRDMLLSKIKGPAA